MKECKVVWIVSGLRQVLASEKADHQVPPVSFLPSQVMRPVIRQTDQEGRQVCGWQTGEEILVPQHCSVRLNITRRMFNIENKPKTQKYTGPSQQTYIILSS